jgi:phosphoglycolate phosphatase
VCGAGPDSERTTKADVVAKALQRLGHPDGRSWSATATTTSEGAAEHGVPCLGVLWGYGDEDELRGAGAAGLVRDLDELLDVLLARG